MATRFILNVVVVVLVFSFLGCTRKHEMGNTLRVAVREKFKTLDPIDAQDYYSNVLLCRSYETLLGYHYLKRPYELTPVLAEAMPKISKDGLTYTFQLKKGVYFQPDEAFGADSRKTGHGREMVADDVVYSLKRLADPHAVSSGWWILDQKIKGINAWREANAKTATTNYAMPVEGLVAKDAYTFEMHLNKPFPLILNLFAMSYTSVVAREVVEKYGAEFRQHPVGTGPFRLESLSSNQAVWKKFEHFHGEAYPSEGAAGDRDAGLLADAGKPLPFVDQLIDDIIIEDQPAWLNFMQFAHDYLMKVPKDNAVAVFDSEGKPQKNLVEKNINVHVVPATDFTYFAFNYEDPVVGGEKNRFLRQAMSMAYDEAPAIEKFYLGLAKKAEYPIPPTVHGYDAALKNPSREYDMVKAREILAKAGHPGGQGIPELTLETRSSSTERQQAEYFQRKMQELGIKVKIVPYSWPELLVRIKKKQAQFWSISWLLDYPDAENAFQLLYGPNESPGTNSANYKNAKWDALYQKMAVLPNGPERIKVIREMQQIFAHDVPWVIAVHRAETRLSHQWVHNFKIHNFSHNIEKYLRIDNDLRKKAIK